MRPNGVLPKSDMRTERIRSWVFGLFAAWPFLLASALILVMTSTRFEPSSSFITLWISAMIVFLLGWIAYLWDVFRNPRVPRDKKALWAAVLFLGGPYAMPFYYWHYLRYRP